jgi:hypothetical protein
MKKPGLIIKTLLLAAALISALEYSYAQTQTFSSSGTFTVPAGVSSIIVEAWGGGGGGSTITYNGRRGGGGGGGAYARSIVNVIPGNSYSVIVGTGGAASSSGGNTSFNNSTVVSAGGSGGTYNSSEGGAGGSEAESHGDVVFPGGNGANGNYSYWYTYYSGAGGGGAGSTGAGGNADGRTAGAGTTQNGGDGGSGVSGSSSGNPGSIYGGGGSGASTSNSQDRTGGSGANGLVIINWSTSYYSRISGNPAVLSNWSSLPGGGGTSPTSFTANNQEFIIQNGHTMTTSGTGWTVSGNNSKIEIQNGGSLTENSQVTIGSNSGLQINTGGILNHNVNSLSIFGGTEMFSSGSTVNYGLAGTQTVLQETYGNLTISGSGIKTLAGTSAVTGTLLLSGGNLSLGSGTNNLIIAGGGNFAATPGFDSNHMIICDGTGSIIKEGDSASDFISVFPTGTGTFYTPFGITSLTATVAGTASISVRAVASTAPGPPAAATTDLTKHFLVSSTGFSSIDANLSITYANPGEVGTGGDQTKYVPMVYTGGSWIQPDIASSSGINPMTVTGTTVIDGQWTAREELIYGTYYSYQSGPWNDPVTWTTDPSGTLSVNPKVPVETDRVVILNGRTVTTTANGENVLSLVINEGGTLDLGTFTSQTFTVIRGKGLLRLSTATYPSGDWSNFVSEEGGTIEYYNSGNFNFSQLVYNNLIINLSTGAVTATLAGNMTINGDLTVTSGNFQVNNTVSTGRNLDIAGDVFIASIGRMSIGTGAAYHRITVKGDFTNEGTVRLTNQASPNYTTPPGNGLSDLVFNNPNAHQNLVCNGQSDFYRIEIDKGIDQTYILNIDANNNTNFKLFGATDMQSSPPSNSPPSIENANALGLLAGTVRLGPNIVILSLADNQVYNIDLDAQLWLDGADVTFTSLAGSSNSIVVYGNLRVSGMATLNANGGQGIVMRDQSALIIESGTVTTDCIRTSYISGAHRGAFTMSGGTLNIEGNSYNISGLGIYASFTLPYPDNVFRMSGGTINILSPTTVISGGSGINFSLLLGMNPNNASVTGGTVNITIPSNRNAYINTTIPLWNLNFTSTSSTYRGQIQAYAGNSSPAIPASPVRPLVIYYDLNVQNNAVFNANGADITVGRNFSINGSSEYETGNNTTSFNGLRGQRFTNAGVINNGTGLFNLAITDSSNTDIYSSDLILRGDLTLEAGSSLNDVGHSITIAGNISNSGTHTSQAGGAVILNGTSDQSIGGSGKGAFGNLTINKTSGNAFFTAGQSVNGNLRLARGILDLSTWNLSLGPNSSIYDALTGTTAAFSSSKMIRLSGNQSDGGITRAFAGVSSFLFPLGTGTDYTPATIQFTSAPSRWGNVTIRPVTLTHPLVTGTNALSYYWTARGEGFGDIQPGSVTWTFQYATSDLTGSENLYIPAAYRPYIWFPINDNSKVVDASNIIQFNNTGYVDGDYTAGELSSFQSIKVYYSRQDGNWNDPSTWSSLSVGGAMDGSVPGSGNPVVIGDRTINHTVVVPEGLNNIVVGGLQINSGSTLDLRTTTGHNFGAIPDTRVSGTGRLRISSSTATAVFPGGDFGNFLAGGGGIVEYYSTATLGQDSFTLPVSYISGTNTISVKGYNNLVTSPASGKNIILPNTDLHIFNDFTVSGAGITQLNILANTRTVEVDSGLMVQSGTLRYMNGSNTAQNMVVFGDVTVASGAVFDINTSGTATNLLTIHGSLTNNGTFDMNTDAGRVCNVTFSGAANREINGTGAVTDFNTIEVNKGSSRNAILEVKSSVLTLNTSLPTALTLTNGTFRLTSPIILNLTNAGSFTIPTSGCLSANGGTINIGGASATNATDLKLDGRLEVLSGNINIGTPGTNLNNDIEYSSGGTPEIIVAGGSLFVNGQIRRVITINTGSLNYTQSNEASTVTIAGRNASDERSMFEILNQGSKFNMSGGRLIISGSFDNSSHTDLYLAPDSSTVTGGTIVLGTTETPSGTAFNIVSSVPLYNVEIDASVNTKTADLRIYPLTIKNNLVIIGNSIFRANGLNITIGGNLINNNSSSGTGLNSGGYQPGTSGQLTTFNGSGTNTISGSGSNLTNFAHLNVAKTGSLTLTPNSNIRINGNLNLLSGTLEDGGNNISLAGNMVNNAEHASTMPGGGIVLEGSQTQTISGNGTGIFGNLTLNNTTGISMVDDATIKGILTFSRGSVYIDDYLITLGVNASIGGTPDENNMIILNGVISDAGVRKIFPSGPSGFTFPVGVAGKYTPAEFLFTSNTSNDASVTVNPVNYSHPLATLPEGDELEYYWKVSSEGFSGGYSVTHTYSYLQEDVNGNESDYSTGRFLNGLWIPEGGIGESSVNPSTHRITLTNRDFIDGEYTAGTSLNFTNKPVLYSIKSGNWAGDNTWSTTDGGPSCNCDPDGNPVVINAGHTVTVNGNSALAYSVTINGTLGIGNTLYHSLGHINGNGLLKVSSTTSGIFVMPGGDYDEFLSNLTSTIELFGNNQAVIPSKPGNIYKPFRNLILSGTGKKIIPADDIKVLGNLTIMGASTVLSNEFSNRSLYVSGNWTDNNISAAGGFIPANGQVIFDGTASQLLTITGGSTTNQFRDLVIRNGAGVTLAGAGKINISGRLTLEAGIISSNSVNILMISNTSENAVIGGGSNSFVSGPLQKRMLAGGDFIFPTGDAAGSRYGCLALTDVTVAGNYTVWYHNYNPLTDGLDPDNKTAPVDVVSDSEYWSVNGPVSSAGDVTLRWDDASGIIPADALTRSKLRVVEWNPSWVNRGNRGLTGNLSSGTIRTSTQVSLAGSHSFTIGVESLPTATITSGPAGICDDGSPATISIDLTGTPPWTLRYRINGASETTLANIANSPYTLVVSNAIPALAAGGPGIYSFTVSYIQDATGSTGIRDFETSAEITLYASPEPSISGLSTTPANSLVTYSAPAVAGITYSWSVTGGVIQSGQSTNSIVVRWGAGPLGTIVLSETVILGGCSSSTSPFQVTITDIPDPEVEGSNSVCLGSTESYSTPLVSGHTYSWTVTGGTYTAGPTSNIINVTWTAAGSGEVRVAETGSATVSSSLPVEINPLPPAGNTVSDPETCANAPASIIVYGAPAGLTYQLRLNTDNTPAGTPVSSMGGGDVILTVTQAVPTTYNVWATNEYGCGTMLTDLAVVGINNDQVWTGATGPDWSVADNWSCGIVPLPDASITIPVSPNDPVISGGETGMINNLVIDPGATLEISGSTLGITGTITGGGIIDAMNGTIVMNGASAQSINPSRFLNNSIRNLDINNTSGVSLSGPLSLTGILRIQNGSLASGGNLTLVSTASGTALIDGSGSGIVTGNVTMQRYLPSAFGYKYISSPFQSATVSGLSDELDLSAGFPVLYRYNEASTTSGWVTYTNPGDPLSPLSGYTANFGSSGVPLTADLTGIVNNGALFATFTNNNNTYTEGFNLAGNPYPSPIDWDATAGWTKTNIDDALYFYRASTTDEYGGTYSTYINGISSDGLASPVIASMQGFFIHVSGGTYPVTGTLGLDNSVRLATLSPSLVKSEEKAPSGILKLTATFSDDPLTADPAIVYFNGKAGSGFDPRLDALKLMNTDYYIPNLYSLGSDGKKLSINALPEFTDTLNVIPLGLKLNIDGDVIFRLAGLPEEINGTRIYLHDRLTGVETEVSEGSEYRVRLDPGEYSGRFFLNLRSTATSIPDPVADELFTVYSSHGFLRAKVKTEVTGPGNLAIINLTGQTVFVERIYENGYIEFNPGIKEGVYIVTFTSSKYRGSKKLYFRNR